MLRFVPLGIACLLLVGIVAASLDGRLNRRLTLASFQLFGGRNIDHDPNRERLLRSAAMGVPYREYASKTYLYAIVVGISTAIIGVYVGIGALGLGDSLGLWRNLAFITTGEPLATPLFVVLVAVCLTFGAIIGFSVYLFRWQLPASRAKKRARQIDTGLPRMVAFMYALTRGGMSVPAVFRALGENKAVFGESAAEAETAVRNMAFFNMDLMTAVGELSEQTPSEQFSTFTENLAGVLQSGGSVSEFLSDQYERYRDEAEEQQAEILNILATTAEVYVTLVVAGMLFLVTILVIVGLTAGGTLSFMRFIAYVVLPGLNLLFLIYLLDVTQPLRASSPRTKNAGSEPGSISGHMLKSDGGYTRTGSAINHGRLIAYRRLRSIRETLATPVASVVERPVRLLYVTVPIAVLVTAYRMPGAVSAGGIDIRVLDDFLVQALLFLMGTFAVVYEYKKRRIRRLEAEVPELLERLASLNEAGIAMVSSFGRVRRSDIGSLDSEVDRIWQDMQWGATTEEALERFEQRIQTPSVTRVVTLITNAMRASNEIGPVLRIAANQARSELALRRQRKQEMFTYLVVIYVSFLVFLIVIIALEQVLIPSLPDTSAISDAPAGATPGIGGILEGGDPDAYRLVFFHTAIIQSALSGLIGGVMGNGSIKDGMKHATAMLTITYLVLNVLA